MLVFNQADDKWRNQPLGTSNTTVGSHGCYTSYAATALANYMQMPDVMTPGFLNIQLNHIGGYTPEGDIIWSAITKLYPDCGLPKFEWTTNYTKAHDIVKMDAGKAIADIKRMVRYGFSVGLCVDNLYKDGWPDHMVTCTYAPDNLDEWVVADSDGGKIIKFREKYGDVRTKLYGYRLLIGPPVATPDYAGKEDITLGIAAWKAWVVANTKDSNKRLVYSREILDTLLSGV